MSRCYRVNVECKGLTPEQLSEMMVVEFGWEEKDCSGYNGVSYFEGEGNLCGGQWEEEAHKQIEVEIKAINPNAKVLTRWTNLEDLPSNQYGEPE